VFAITFLRGLIIILIGYKGSLDQDSNQKSLAHDTTTPNTLVQDTKTLNR
jgi:hypothetical protein